MHGRLRGRSLVVLASAVFVLAACTGGDPAEEGGGDGGTGSSASDLRVGLSFDIGGLGDKGFNDAAYAGLQRAIEDGLVTEENTKYLEANATGSNRAANTESLADAGYDLIVAASYAFSSDVDKLAKQFPDTYFAVVDGFSAKAPKVTNLVFKEHEGSYLVGVAAAERSETGHIGFLGGQEGTGVIEKFEAGYEAGARSVNPDIEIDVEYIGDTTAAFNDLTKGEALSAQMYDNGADVVFHAAGKSGLGLFKAAVAADALAIGVDLDQSLSASAEEQPHILTSMLKRVDNAVYDTIENLVNDKFIAGYQTFGLNENGVDYAVNEFNDSEALMSEELQSQLDEIEQQIIHGDIVVPEKPRA